jgi:hypothetical protein
MKFSDCLFGADSTNDNQQVGGRGSKKNNQNGDQSVVDDALNAPPTAATATITDIPAMAIPRTLIVS